MCKILCLTSHDPAARNDIILRAWKAMSAGNNDGFGAAWVSPDGHIGYFKRSHARIDDLPSLDFVHKKTYLTYSKVTTPFSQSNDIPSDGGFLIIHARNATNAVNVANTHPFVTEDAAMVHNGVVRSAKYKNEAPGCTCDSELLFSAYRHGGIKEVTDEIEGSFAFMFLQVSGAEKKRTLHIAKDDRASLECGYIAADKTFAFATTEHLLGVVGAESMGEVDDGTLVVFEDAKTMSAFDFDPPGFKSKVSSEIQKQIDQSLGIGPHESGWERAHGVGAHTQTYPDKSFDKTQWEADQDEIEKYEKMAIDEAAFGIGA